MQTLEQELISPGKRLVSLDAFRGFTIALMIVVNDPGSWSHVYAPLLHADWHGITPTDFVFPFFLFIVGVSIAFAYTKRLAANVPKKQMFRKIIKRTLIIFALGLFLALFPRFNFPNLRIPGRLWTEHCEQRNCTGRSSGWMAQTLTAKTGKLSS